MATNVYNTLFNGIKAELIDSEQDNIGLDTGNVIINNGDVNAVMSELVDKESIVVISYNKENNIKEPVNYHNAYIADVQFTIDILTQVEGQYDHNRETVLDLSEKVIGRLLGKVIAEVASDITIDSQEFVGVAKAGGVFKAWVQQTYIIQIVKSY